MLPDSASSFLLKKNLPKNVVETDLALFFSINQTTSFYNLLFSEQFIDTNSKDSDLTQDFSAIFKNFSQYNIEKIEFAEDFEHIVPS